MCGNPNSRLSLALSNYAHIQYILFAIYLQLENTTSIFVASYMVSLVLAMAIEMPSSAIQKLIFKRERVVEKDYKVNPQDSKLSKDCTLELSAKIVHPWKERWAD